MCWMKLCWTKCVGCNFVKIIENKLHQMCFCTFLCFNFHLHFFLSFFLISFIIFHHSYIGFFLSYSFSSFITDTYFIIIIIFYFFSTSFFLQSKENSECFKQFLLQIWRFWLQTISFWYINFILNNALMNEDLKYYLFTI